MDTLSNHIATLDDITLASSTTIRNLGAIFDQDLYLTSCKFQGLPSSTF